LFPSDPATSELAAVGDSRRLRIGAAYLAGSFGLVGSALWVGGAAWWLLWPAGSLAVVAGVYFIGRPDLFQKANGAMPPAMVGLLAPYLLVAWLNTRLWTWNAGPANEIADGVWLGRVHSEAELLARRFRSIVDLNAELPVATAGLGYHAVPMLDLLPPTVEQLEAAVEAIQWSERPTLVCCALGYSRSAAAVAAWLMASGRSSSVEGAISQIAARRPQIALGPAHRARLEDWFCRRGGR
jgi:protein-tyrosine phosphatase